MSTTATATTARPRAASPATRARRLRALAEELGVSLRTLEQDCRALVSDAAVEQQSQAQRERAARQQRLGALLAAAGDELPDLGVLAAELGVSTATISRDLRALGVSTRLRAGVRRRARHQRLRALLAEAPPLSQAEMARRLGVDGATIVRDLRDLGIER